MDKIKQSNPCQNRTENRPLSYLGIIGLTGNCRGSALLLAVVVLTVLLVLAGGLISLAGTESVSGVHQVNQMQAYYIAEAGVEKALAALKLDPLWRVGFNGLGYAGGIVQEVTISTLASESTPDTTVVLIRSRGTYSGANRTVEVKAGLSSDPYVEAGRAGTTPLQELRSTTSPVEVHGDVFLAGDCRLDWDILINGTIRAGDSVEIRAPARVTGDVCAGGSIVADDETVDGLLYPGQSISVPPFPSLTPDDLSFFREAALASGDNNYFPGNHVFTPTELQNMQGIYFVEGKAAVAGVYSGRASIVAGGDIVIAGPLYAANLQQDVLGLISPGVVTTDVNCHLAQTVVFAREGFVTRGAMLEQYGSVIAPVLELGGSIILMDNHPLFVPPGMPVNVRIIIWKERFSIF